jgi:ABC-type transport system substrate-binding protein
VCGAVRNYTGYCNPEVDKLIDQKSAEANREKRKQLVWQIERKLAEEQARPIIFYPRNGTCTQPYVKGLMPWSTASTTATAWKTSGSTNNPPAPKMTPADRRGWRAPRRGEMR